MPMSKGLRYAAFVGTLVGAIGITVYAVIIDPKLHPDKWNEIQKTVREGKSKEETQPGGMKVWEDPFGRKKSSS